MVLTANSSNRDLKDFYNSLNSFLQAREMKLLPDITVRWSDRMGSALAKTYGKNKTNGLEAYEIVMNHRLFRKEGDKYSVDSTLRHEAAHAWTAQHCGRLDHSDAWRHVARILGDTGDRCAIVNDFKNEKKALRSAALVPTQHEDLTKRQIHQLRCALKAVVRRTGGKPTTRLFNTFVRPRFPQFSQKALDEAVKILIV